MGEYLTVNEKISYSKVAEENGLASAWIAEHYYYRDAVVTAAAILSHTKKLIVGTSIINPFTRHPALLAMTSATLSEMSGGRFILGLGLGIPLWIEQQMGIDMGSQIVSLRESVQLIKSLLSGESFADGKRFVARNVKLGFGTDDHRTPVYIAGVKSRMLELAAAYGDGVILPAGSSPDYVRKAIPIINGSLKKSKKANTEIVCLAYLLVDQDSRLAKTKVKPWLFPILMRPDREELILADKPEEKTRVKQAKKYMITGDREKAESLVDDGILEAISISGNSDECLRAIREFAKAGVTHLVLNPTESKPATLEKFYAKLNL